MTTYIVLLHAHVDKQTHLAWLDQHHQNSSRVINNYSVLHAYSAELQDSALHALTSSADVRKVEEDVELEYDSIVVEDHSGWGLNRISQIPSLKGQYALFEGFHYTYEDPGHLDVDIYIIESGCRITHEDFEGRAFYGYTDPQLNDSDSPKHGTETASCAGGKRCGVAKHANLVICRTHNKTSNSITTLDWIIQRFHATGTPAVVNMSFGRKDKDHKYTALDEAVTNTVAAGIHCCASAGNDDLDANCKTPARAVGCNAIAASNINDARASFSNYGSVVKLFAPGEQVLTADVASDTRYSYHDGTSFSSPYVAGLIAYHISLTRNIPPPAMTKWLQTTAIADALTNVPSGTVNLLAYNSVDGAAN